MPIQPARTQTYVSQIGEPIHRTNSTAWMVALAAILFCATRIVLWLTVLAFLVSPIPGGWAQPPVGSRGPISFRESYTYPDGVVLKVTEASSGLLTEVPYSEDPSAQIGDPYTVITVELHNGSVHTLDAWLIGRVSYGPHRRPASRFATRTVTDLGSVQLIAPGETAHPYSLGFLIPADAHDDVEFTLSVDPGKHRKAVFAGSLDQVRTTR